ncbi:hypothetical protein KI387_003285, partial [Taxus chinensis]
MEEDKAAAYYDELARKGGGAARFKQGLGYSSQSSQEPPNKGNAPFALSNFVKAASPVRAEAIGKEIQIENIREKLKKKGEYLPEQQKGRDVSKSLRTRREDTSDASGERDRSRSHSPKRIKEKSHERNGRHSRHRDYRSRSPYERHSRHRSKSAGRSSTHNNKRRHQRSYSRGNRNRSTSSDRSRDHHRHRRVRCRSSNSSSSQSHDSSYTRKIRREPSISFSGSEEDGRSSPYHSRRRGRGRSRSPSRRDYSKERTGKLNRNSSSRQQRTREEGLPHRNRKIDETKLSSRHNGKETTLKGNASSFKEKSQNLDYSKLIDGFDSMTPAEKVKAKMRLQLSETVVKDAKKGMSEEWERFDFNKEAPLDDDTKLDYFGDDTGAKDDTEFLRNTGTTFLSTAGQAKRESEIQAAHEAAIFGTRIHSSDNPPDLNPIIENTSQSDQNEDKIACMIKSDTVEDKGSKGNVLGNSLISEQ